MNSTALRALVALASLACCGALRAAPVEPCVSAYQKDIAGQSVPADSVYAVITREQGSGCILGQADGTGIEQLLETLRDAKTDAEKAASRQMLFERVLAQFEGLPSTPCDGNTIACSAGRHVAKIRELQQALNAGPVDPRSPLIAQNSWPLVPAIHTIRISNIDLLALLTNECAAGAQSPQCIAAVDFSAKVIRTGESMHQLTDAYSQPIIEADNRFLTERDKEWNSYLNDVSVQYPWELWLNGYLFQKATPAAQRSQFPLAPTSKWVFLHPSPAFERVEGPTGGHSTQAAVVAEIAGYEMWRWSGSGAASNRWGASVITSFVDARGSSAVGYGLLLKTPFKNASVGVVFRNGDRGRQVNLAINVDLAKLIQKYKDVDIKKFVGTSLGGLP
jgi:hypothetical protein